MLTSYLVRCPHVGCNWFGSLLPLNNPEAWANSTPTVKIATFQCPRCQGDFQGQIKGDDVIPLPQEAIAAS